VANSLRSNRDETVLKLFTSTDGTTLGFTESEIATPARCEVSKYRPKPGENGGVDAPPPIFRNQN
jgi:hypothetical protein